MIKAGIIGGSGYTGGELIRLLLHHPSATLDFVFSTTRAGTSISETHTDLLGTTTLKFTDKVNPDADVIFLCLGHGNSTQFLQDHSFSEKTRIIDLSNDFRLGKQNTLDKRSFVYGLPELRKEEICKAKNVANPGCFATAIQLALLPLAKAQMLNHEVHINATTGSTGAGVSLSNTTHYSWRENNMSHYKAFIHQHLDEINESLEHFQPQKGKLRFIPNRGNFTRGIWATAYTRFEGKQEEADALYKDYYKDEPFTHVSEKAISLKPVINSNNCHLNLLVHDGVLLIASAIDNLLKGASGQAVQNMNLMFGLPEGEGLHLKSSIF
ncbi:N-acetyl-gamma-glutamyl-phosphate reductase [Muriicola soli]|uniref:N-acetyl-gamma-glutamyl-phosphate reductase n=1 Tax=Muriicola soli TaxID=2507538 RepID=A0A411EBD2_9FLAO|nr:N-acetyl-gamma-glutamyl-phosphate reductase [Muriicola soli]QBA65041.1 N-acetyl-gamma-glutamyl-phosphate reductase [Muriicola soli]